MSFNERHSLGVANYMREHSKEFNLNPDHMWFMGFVHNVGEIFEGHHHEDDGAVLLSDLGFKFSQLVAWHGSSPVAYCNSVLVDEPPKELVLLWKAIYSTNSDGDHVGYEHVLSDLKSEYGLLNIKYMVAAETIDWLKKYEERQ